ncbi:hypothetical protein LCGC14_2418970 [marine sediment metagenome]|uniref:Uncharacterized protein n=1 Tax=marine sediment metagenome TaxID=412755 RepID=A0A0F9CCE8_9ZZZZ
MRLQGLTFPKPYQKKVISANSSGVVLSILIPANMTGFISQVANNWYSNTYFVFKVNGMPIEDRIEREMAPVNIPMTYNPPIIARKKIEWIAFNNTSDDLEFEILCNGTMYKEI